MNARCDSRIANPGLDDFADDIVAANPSEQCQDIYQRFSLDPELLSIPVVANDLPVGLVHRSDFMMKLAHSYGWALYAKKPIRVLMDQDPLVVDRSTALETVQSQIAVDRPSALVKGFIITRDGRYAALGTALSLIRYSVVATQARSLELSAALAAAQSASAAKSTFLATMSHELRTPLNAVIGFSDLIAGQVWGDLDPRYVDYANCIRDGGQILLSIITDILDFAKIERGSVDLREGEVDLHVEAERIVRTLSGQAQTRNVKLSHASGPSPHVWADQRLIRQILMNLIGNGLKFTPGGGEVTVSCGIGQGRRPFLKVTDSGCGMSEAEIQIALQPFGQVDNGLGRASEGTGLGLPLVKAFVEAHGGTLTIESASGRGTAMTVYLPSDRLIEVLSEAAA
jgi:two-component system cell cycle sensor histidine kinase PleC